MSNSVGSNNIETLYKMDDDRVEALEFIIPEGSPVVGIPLIDLSIKKNTLIACINHSGEIIMPDGQSKMYPNDTVIVVTTQRGFNSVNDILAD